MSAVSYAAATLVRPQKSKSAEAFRPVNLAARLAYDRKTKSDAYRLRHDSYLAGNYIDPMPGGLFSDSYDELPNSQSLVVYQHNRPVASVRLCLLDTNPERSGFDKIPSIGVFGEEVNAAMQAHPIAGVASPKAVEITRLVRHPDFANDFSLVFIMFRLITFMVVKENANIAMSCCRYNHTKFYQRLAFEKVAGPRHYPGVKFETNLVVCGQEKYADVVNNIPVFNGMSTDAARYEKLFDGDTINIFGAN
jgi:hypothetical protein